MNDEKIDELIRKALQEEQAFPEGLSRRLEERIDALAAKEEEEKRKTRPLPRRRQMLYWLSGAAASILLCAGLFHYEAPSRGSRLADTYTNPREAAATAEKALLLLSQNLNKGISQVDGAGQEIEKVNNILNKHLND